MATKKINKILVQYDDGTYEEVPADSGIKSEGLTGFLPKQLLIDTAENVKNKSENDGMLLTE